MGNDSSNQSNNYNNLILEHYKNYNYNDIKFKVDCNVHKNEDMNEFIYKLNANIFNSNPPEFFLLLTNLDLWVIIIILLFQKQFLKF